MITAPWTTVGPAPAGNDTVVVATRFTARHRPHVPAIVVAARELVGSLPTTPGLIGYGFRLSPMRGRVEALTAWSTESALNDFVLAPIHQRAVRLTRRWLAHADIVRWRVSADDPEPTWIDADRHFHALPRGRPNPLSRGSAPT